MSKDNSRFKEKDDRTPVKPGNTRKTTTNARRNSKPSKQRYNVAEKADRFEAAQKRDMWASDGNDPRWYNQFPDLVRNFANFNFRAPVGSKVTLDPSKLHPDIDADRYPGVMALYFCPCAGTKTEANASMLNLAATRLYQFTRFENNGSSKYSRGSLMLYFLAMDSCYMYHAWVKRIYSSMRQFSSMNRYLPRALMRAERVDYDDLEKKLPLLRGWINKFADKLSVLPIPHSMSYMARHSWMANSLFVDTDTVKCQLYMFVPQYYQIYRVADGTGTLPVGTPWLQYVNPSYGNAAMTLDDIINFGNSMIDPLIQTEDFNLIGADVLKAFGSNGVVTLDQIPDDYVSYPVYSEEVLNQIQAATAIGHPACYGSVQLPAQNNGASIYWDGTNNTLVPNDEVWSPFDINQEYQLDSYPFYTNKIINFESDSITNDDIMVATRLTQIAQTQRSITDNDGNSRVVIRYKTLGSEFVTQYAMFFFTEAPAMPGDPLGPWRIGNTTLGYYGRPDTIAAPYGDATTPGADWAANAQAALIRSKVTTRDNMRFLSTLEQFNRHPYIMLYPFIEYVEDDGKGGSTYKGHSTFVYTNSKVIGDTANFAVFEEADLINLSDVALQSEFFVPLTASGALKTSAI